MKGLMICALATVEVLGVIFLMGRRRHPREVADHIDRDFRDLMRRVRWGNDAVPWADWGG